MMGTLGQSLTDVVHQAFHLRLAACRRILIGGPQTRTQQMLAAKDIQRQLTIAVVIAVKKAPFLVAVQGQIGHIQIQDKAFRGVRVRFQKHTDQ